MADDFSADILTTGAVAVDGLATGNIEVPADHDWFRVTLTAGVQYAMEMRSRGANGTLVDPYLRFLDSTGALIRDNEAAGPGLARVVFTPSVTGAYYIDAGNNYLDSGTYTVAVIGDFTFSLFTEGDDTVRLFLVGAQPGGIWHALGGHDFVWGTAGIDEIYGDDGNDYLDGLEGNDRLYGGAGDDTFGAGIGDRVYDGGTGVDRVWYHNLLGFGAFSIILDDSGDGFATGNGTHTLVSIENIWGTNDPAGDVIITGAADNEIHGIAGPDFIDAGDGSDIVYGGYGDYSVIAGGGNDTVYCDEPGVGSTNNNDVILLDDYRNPLTSTGDDTAYGGPGDDLLWGYGGNDTLYGGSGDDDLVGNDLTLAVAGMNWLYGGDGNDQLFVGLAGSAALTGDAGNDSLYGGPETDTLNGGAGNDFMYGAGGADQFYVLDYFAPRAAVETDIIYLFNAAEGDTLHFFRSSGPYGALTMTDQVFNLPGVGNVNSVYMYNADGKWSAVVYGVDVATLQSSIEYIDLIPV